MVQRSSARYRMCGAGRGKSLIEGSVVFLEQLGYRPKLNEAARSVRLTEGKTFHFLTLRQRRFVSMCIRLK